jgi:hypothetical protein
MAKRAKKRKNWRVILSWADIYQAHLMCGRRASGLALKRQIKRGKVRRLASGRYQLTGN